MIRRPLLFLSILLVPLAASLVSCGGKKEVGFRHDGHVTLTKGNCASCHGGDPGAPRAATLSDCISCHKGEKALESFTPPPPAAERAVARRSRGYADVIFSHAPHARADVPCGACHPPTPGAAAGIPSFPAMAQCRECHDREGFSKDCRTCHRNRRQAAHPPRPSTADPRRSPPGRVPSRPDASRTR